MKSLHRCSRALISTPFLLHTFHFKLRSTMRVLRMESKVKEAPRRSEICMRDVQANISGLAWPVF